MYREIIFIYLLIFYIFMGKKDDDSQNNILVQISNGVQLTIALRWLHTVTFIG